MFTKTFAAAVLATTLAAGLAPAFAETSAVPEAPMAAAKGHSAYSVSGLSSAQLAQIAGSAGVTLDQAKGMTLSQLYFLKESRDSDNPAHWKAQEPLPSHVL